MPKIRISILCLSLFTPGWSVAQSSSVGAPADPATNPISAAVTEQVHRLEKEVQAQQGQIARQQAQIDELLQKLGNTAAPPKLPSESDAKSTGASYPQPLQEARKSPSAEPSNPSTIRYKGLSLSPVGFVTADAVFRTRNENADMGSSFGALPFGGVANSHLSELRASARASRFGLLAVGMAGNTRLTGYYEMDFLGQAPTANQIETNSFTPRQRQLWVQVDFSNGLTLTAGQDWSLLTTDRKGIATRAEFIPNTLDASYVVGYNYVRQTAFRITKNFNDRIWAAFELANPETSQPNASFVPANLFGFNNSSNAASPSGFTLNFLSGSTNGFSTNLAPDLIAKIAWEPGWGHYELKALGRFFRDRINGDNNIAYGGGLGAAAILPVVAKKADFILEALAGNGIGRYGTALGSDITIRPDGWIIPIHTVHVMTGLEAHAQPKLDLYVYGGNEYYGRAAYVNPNNASEPAGYGSLLVNNTNCQVEVVPSGGAACGAQNRDVWEASTGLWYRFYKGPYGAFQYGWQYEYLHRSTWTGIAGSPSGLDSVVMTSVRFLLP